MTRRNWLWLAVLLALPVLLWLGIWARWSYQLSVENDAFAEEVFGGVIPYDADLSSKKWFHLYPIDLFSFFGSGRFECTWSVVRLAAAAPDAPPSENAQPDRKVFTASPHQPWQRGPAPSSFVQPDTTFGDCIRWGGLGGQRDILLQAANDPNGWWRDDYGEVYLYSKSARVAAWIRFGD